MSNLAELKIALDPNNPRNILPPSLPPSHVVLDIGCGAGQTMIASYPDRVSYGIDISLDALKMGRALTDRVRFTQGTAERLPFRSESFDLVVARVSLPYTNLRKSLPEIYRILRPGGRMWATLHPIGIPYEQAGLSNFKGKLLFLYVAVNGILLHLGLPQLSLFGSSESFQTCRGMRLALEASGFEGISVGFQKIHLLAEARRPS